MPINMSIEYPKLQNEVSKLRFQNDKLIEALKEVVNLSDAADYWTNKEGWGKIEKAQQLLNEIEKETL